MAARRDIQDERHPELVWGARTDVGHARPHNEDSYADVAPLFVVCDGMGGHEAGEVASAIAVTIIADEAPISLDDTALGAAVEAANQAIIGAWSQGVGKEGMGCTATAVQIFGDKMAVAHVGDSRCYLLRAGQIVRITHDHSYVEELVDAGEITADEARVHPARSIITRALGSDPEMYADHFTLDVEKGDRIILCSDGLSSMIADEAIEDVALSCPTPQNCADALVQAALDAGGFDNVTVVVVDVARDAVAERHARQMMRGAFGVLLGMVALLIAAFIGFSLFVGKSWFVGSENGEVAIYKGIHGDFFGMNLYELTERTGVVVSDLPDATQKSLEEGIATASEDAARATVESYRSQIGLERQKAADTEEAASSATHDDGANAAPTSASPTSPATTTSAAPASDSSEGAGAGVNATSVGADAPAAEEGGE